MRLEAPPCIGFEAFCIHAAALAARLGFSGPAVAHCRAGQKKQEANRACEKSEPDLPAAGQAASLQEADSVLEVGNHAAANSQCESSEPGQHAFGQAAQMQEADSLDVSTHVAANSASEKNLTGQQQAADSVLDVLSHAATNSACDKSVPGQQQAAYSVLDVSNHAAANSQCENSEPGQHAFGQAAQRQAADSLDAMTHAAAKSACVKSEPGQQQAVDSVLEVSSHAAANSQYVAGETLQKKDYEAIDDEVRKWVVKKLGPSSDLAEGLEVAMGAVEALESEDLKDAGATGSALAAPSALEALEREDPKDDGAASWSSVNQLLGLLRERLAEVEGKEEAAELKATIDAVILGSSLFEG